MRVDTMNIDYDGLRAKAEAALHHRHTGDCFNHKSQMVCVVAEIEDNAIELVLSLLDRIAELEQLVAHSIAATWKPEDFEEYRRLVNPNATHEQVIGGRE